MLRHRHIRAGRWFNRRLPIAAIFGRPERKFRGMNQDTKVVVVRRRGKQPVAVDFSDGTRSWYFCGDLPAHKRGGESGAYPPHRIFHGHPPNVGDELDAG